MFEIKFLCLEIVFIFCDYCGGVNLKRIEKILLLFIGK